MLPSKRPTEQKTEQLRPPGPLRSRNDPEKEDAAGLGPPGAGWGLATGFFFPNAGQPRINRTLPLKSEKSNDTNFSRRR